MAPILLFAFKRLDTLKLTVEALQKDNLALQSDLIVFSDNARNVKDQDSIKKVRNYLKTITGFRSVNLMFSVENQGLAKSIISGVSKIISTSQEVIVLEDDIEVSPNFLTYMNQALKFYKDNPNVFSIAGYTLPIKVQNDYMYDVFFTHRSSSWGWATWKDRWEKIDWSCASYTDFKNNRAERLAFNEIGSDMNKMLDKQMTGQLDSWAIRWCYHQFKTNTYSVHPVISKVNNIGFSNEATNTSNYNRYQTVLDSGKKMNFNFPDKVNTETDLTYLYSDFYSIKNRIIGKLLTYLMKLGLIRK